MKKTPIFIGVLAILILIAINFFALSSENKLFAISSLILLLSIVFLIFLIFNKFYNRVIKRLEPWVVLSISYLMLANIILFGTKFFSVEWAFLAFLFAAVLFNDYKIDSRFLILPALILLGYIPFLLIAKQNAIAETMAVYVYYFLVVGVGLQIFEYYKKEEKIFDFDMVFDFILKRVNWILIIILSGLLTIYLIVFSSFKSIELYKWSSVYFFVVVLIIYSISILKNKKDFNMN